MFPEEKGFILAIREQPDDATPRLAYADWLEEHCDPRAELLRAYGKPDWEDKLKELRPRVGYKETAVLLCDLNWLPTYHITLQEGATIRTFLPREPLGPDWRKKLQFKVKQGRQMKVYLLQVGKKNTFQEVMDIRNNTMDKRLARIEHFLTFLDQHEDALEEGWDMWCLGSSFIFQGEAEFPHLNYFSEFGRYPSLDWYNRQFSGGDERILLMNRE